MTNLTTVVLLFTLCLIFIHGLLLVNINEQPKTTLTSISHKDVLIFLMKEVIQIKNSLQEKNKELDKIRSTVANQTQTIFNLTKELESMMNGRNILNSDEIRNLSNEVAELKFTVQNELANRFQTLTSTNSTELFSRLHKLENSVAHLMNQNVSTSEIADLEQRFLASSVTYITKLETVLQSFMKNVSERVTALEQDKIVPGKTTIWQLKYNYVKIKSNI